MARDIIIPQARSLLQPLLDYNAKLQEPESFRRNVLLLPPTLKDVLIAINVFPILPTIAKAFPALLLNIVLLIQEFNPKTSLAPSSSTPGPPSLGEEHSPFSRQYHLEELQTEVNNTFRSLCDSVYSASAEELDKSIVHSNSDLNDLRAYKFFYYGQ